MSDSVLDIFREEAREHLTALEQGFLDLESAETVDRRRSLIDSAFRHVHSLKGDAKVVGLTGLKTAAQSLEDLLDELRHNPETVGQDHIDRGLAQFDCVREAFDVWQQQGSAGEIAAAPREVAPSTVAAQPTTATALDLPVPEFAELADSLTSSQASSAKPSLIASVNQENFTVRVPSERLDRMLNMAGEVRIFQRSADAVQNRLNDLSEHLSATLRSLDSQLSAESRQPLQVALDQVRCVTGELHSKSVREERLLEGLESDIRQARLLPLVMLTDMLRRVVRDLAQSLGKPLRYEAEVGAIMLDKAVIEALKEPLMHLIRNAADHGVESPELRRTIGKPPEAVIAIKAAQRGQLVRITVSDDGQGVDFAKIRARLCRTNELAEDQVDGLTDQELVPFLFRPGFTTASTGEVSGRGVGLDVVSDTVRQLQGTVELAATSDGGSMFAITVPVTISTVRIMTVSCGGQSYGVPTLSISKTGRVKRTNLLKLEQASVLLVDGDPVPWRSLADLLGAAPSPQSKLSDTSTYLLIDSDGKRLAVEVEDVEDESEVLLKPLGFPINRQPGIVGATIRADGSVQLVLDLTHSHWTDTAPAIAIVRDRSRTIGRIMVVDDSPITRAVLRKVFVAAGFAVITATDGIDALEQLRTQKVDVVVTDVEMPRLNGFDLTRRIKSKIGIPVILVTGREQEEFRREGLASGADAYVVKSTFEDQSLLEIVEQFMS